MLGMTNMVEFHLPRHPIVPFSRAGDHLSVSFVLSRHDVGSSGMACCDCVRISCIRLRFYVSQISLSDYSLDGNAVTRRVNEPVTQSKQCLLCFF